MDEFCQPVETQVGIIRGQRTALFLDTFDYDGNTLFLQGTLDNALPDQTDLYFAIVFREALALQVLELDSWLASGWSDNRKSSFDEVIHSRWIAQLGGKVNPDQHKHYSICTYDEVIDVVCRECSLRIRKDV